MTSWRIFRVPLLLTAITLVGLVSALLDDGPWDVLSWAALSLPLAVIVWCVVRAH